MEKFEIFRIKPYRKITNTFLLVIFMVSVFCQSTLADTISGVIRDAKTKEPLPFVNILVKNTTTGAMTDIQGSFQCKINHFPCSILIRFIGYKSQEILVTSADKDISVYLEEDIQSLEEVTVKPDNSLDLILLRRIIKNRKLNNPDNLKQISYKNYGRTSVFLSNIDKEKINASKMFGKYSSVMVASSDSTVMMPFFINEDVTHHYRKESDKDEITETVAEKSDGVLSEINDQVKSVLANRLTTEFNFYDNQINVLQKGFPSPISSSSLLYYNVYITDSITRAGTKYFKFNFYPKSYKNITFKGHFWVENKNWALTEIRATLPNSANLNFVTDFSVVVNYQPTKEGKWFYKEQKTNLNLSVTKQKDGKSKRKRFVVQKLNSYAELLNQPLEFKSHVSKGMNLGVDSLLNQERISAPLDTFEQAAYSGIKTLKKNPLIKSVDKFSAMTLNGYYNLNKVDLGPYFSFYRKNSIEGSRVTIPLRTSQKLFERFMVGGYLGYGFKNKAFAYGSNIAYQFKTDKRTILSSKFHYDYFDLTRNRFIEFIKENPYQQGSGNILSAFTSSVPNPYMIKNQHLDITLEHQVNKSVGLLLRASHNRYFSNINLPFTANGRSLSHFNTQDILFDTRLSFSQDYDEGFFSRIYYGNEKPVFHLTALLGRYDLGNKSSNSTGYYAHLNASMKSRFNMGPAFLKLLIEGGGIIGDVPYPLLNLPRGTRNIGAARYHYNLLYHASYASDVYINTHLALNGGGVIFNKLPLIKHLNFREMVTFKSYYGKMLGNHDSVMDIPNYLRTKMDAPYMEMSAGVTNIFKCLRVDYVKRINNGDTFNQFSAKHGIRFRIEVSF